MLSLQPLAATNVARAESKDPKGHQHIDKIHYLLSCFKTKKAGGGLSIAEQDLPAWRDASFLRPLQRLATYLPLLFKATELSYKQKTKTSIQRKQWLSRMLV
jgi:hypothetical protein